MIFKTDNSAKPTNRYFGYKLGRLLSSLNHTYNEYEKIAEKMQCIDEKMALLNIATETRQYATELNSQLQCLDIPHIKESQDFETNQISEYVYAMIPTDDDKHKLSRICYENEHLLMDAYQEVLKEYIPIEFLKQIITHQLTGIKSAFIKIKLLDSLKFSN